MSTSSGAEPRGVAAARAPFWGPWLFGPGVDLGVFGGSALLALGLVFGLRALGHEPGALPAYGWLILVLGVDVAHVYSTLFRTYFDRAELRAHRLRYTLVPLAAYLLGVLLYSAGSLWFWRVLAYVAVFHFVRQQVGWVALYRARSLGPGSAISRVDKWLDELVVYAATLYPVIHWHAYIHTRKFSWFVENDFFDVSAYALQVLPIAKAVWGLALVLFVTRQIWLWRLEGRVHLGKGVVVLTTVLTWYVGIVATNSDAEFTITNVLVHGVPYMALLFFYAKQRAKLAPEEPGSHIVSGGLVAFMGCLLLLAFLEEFAWDRLVWKDHPWLFGASETTLGAMAMTFLVPLLALPQFTHYLLDGVLWRRRDSRANAAQRAAIGMGGERTG